MALQVNSLSTPPVSPHRATGADDLADLYAFARRWLRQPGFDLMMSANLDYVRREREKAIKGGWWLE